MVKELKELKVGVNINESIIRFSLKTAWTPQNVNQKTYIEGQGFIILEYKNSDVIFRFKEGNGVLHEIFVTDNLVVDLHDYYSKDNIISFVANIPNNSGTIELYEPYQPKNLLESAILESVYKQYTESNVFLPKLENAKLLDKFKDDVLNINSLFNIKELKIEDVKNFWGNIFNIPDNVLDKEIQQTFYIDDTFYRYVVDMMIFRTTWNGSLNSLEEFLQRKYEDYGIKITVLDDGFMTLIYSIYDESREFLIDYFEDLDLLPRTMGVDIKIILPNKVIWGALTNQTDENQYVGGFTTNTIDNAGVVLHNGTRGI